MGLLDRLSSKASKEPGAGTQPGKDPSLPKKILVVEDDQALSEALSLKFTKAGYSVSKVTDGQQGLDMVSADKPDVVILDLMMPGMDGMTMLRRLRQNPDLASLPVVVLTNAGSLDNIREATTYLGVSVFLIKSNVNLDEVLEKVKKLI